MSCTLLGVAMLAPQHKKKAAHAPPAHHATPQPSFSSSVAPVLVKDCIRCHSGSEAAAGVKIDELLKTASVGNDRDSWERIARMVESGAMPPSGAKPSAAQRKGMIAWIRGAIAEQCRLPDPGRVTMRRLNRLEYNNTVRDLTGLDLHLADDFPSDDVGYGFDNIGDVLSISPLLMEKYLKAAEIISNKALVIPSSAPIVFDSNKLQGTTGTSPGPSDELILFSEGEVFANYNFRVSGEYRIRVRAYGQQAGPDPTRMAIQLDGKPLQNFDVKATEVSPQVYEKSVFVPAGQHRIGAAFINDFYDPGPPVRDRNLVVKDIELVAPTVPYGDLPEFHRRIIFEPLTPANRLDATRKILARFAFRAFRRPPEPQELDRLVQLADITYKQGESPERGIQVGVQAILSSPNFIFRVERDGASPKIGPYEMASRLSYFIWGSMPDDELLRLAGTGQLENETVVAAQAKRMLADARAEAVVDGFAMQWLNLRKMSIVNPNPTQFPEFNESMRKNMLTETRMFFDSILRNDSKLTDFINGKYTFLNEPLAKLYGIADVTGNDFRKVSLEGTPRGGLITQASILTLTSNPTRTSPVKRGKWILENILDQPPPPPPPGVPQLPDSDPATTKPSTVRALMEQHRKNAVCASCHMRMDPLGFSLENFNPVGKWRTTEGKSPIDASGVLPDGTKFDGAHELTQILMRRKSDFIRCLSDKMLTYATGRGMESADKCSIDAVAKETESLGAKFSSLVCSVVSSAPFRTRHESPVK